MSPCLSSWVAAFCTGCIVTPTLDRWGRLCFTAWIGAGCCFRCCSVWPPSCSVPCAGNSRWSHWVNTPRWWTAFMLYLYLMLPVWLFRAVASSRAVVFSRNTMAYPLRRPWEQSWLSASSMPCFCSPSVSASCSHSLPCSIVSSTWQAPTSSLSWGASRPRAIWSPCFVSLPRFFSCG